MVASRQSEEEIKPGVILTDIIKPGLLNGQCVPTLVENWLVLKELADYRLV